MAESKDTLVYMAKLAEQAERYDEMKDYMREVCSKGQPLTVEERNLLSVAYKNAVGSRRASWRIISSVQQKEGNKGNQQNATEAGDYKKKIESELNEICLQIITLLSEKLIKPIKEEGDSDSAESLVFFRKMKGDYYRYMAEYQSVTGEGEDSPALNAKEAYTQAYDEAMSSLAVTHPIRLGLALNFSVFHYEVLTNPDEACAMARKAFEDAIAELDNVSEDSYKDSTLIMQLLRDNLTLWTSDEQGGE